jgi:hypothetical protein
VSSRDVAALEHVCTISLGPWRGGPYDPLQATLPCDFVATESRDDMLQHFLPGWCDHISDWDSDWETAYAVLDLPAFSEVGWWTNPGLYWPNSEGFIFRALRYAIVTLYACARYVDDWPEFAKACGTTSSRLRKRIETGDWNVRLDKMCDTSQCNLLIDSGGRMGFPPNANNTANVLRANEWWIVGEYKGISVTKTTGLNDGLHTQAAVADYHFWWAHRLHDYALGGNVGFLDALRYYYVGAMCARAALTEIVDIAGLLLHEITHTMGTPEDAYECTVNGEAIRCCRYMLSWLFRHRLMAEFGLPLSRAAGCEQIEVFPRTPSGDFRSQFDFDGDEPWSYWYQFTPTTVGECNASFLRGEHCNLLVPAHGLVAEWLYPKRCADGDVFVPGYTAGDWELPRDGCPSHGAASSGGGGPGRPADAIPRGEPQGSIHGLVDGRMEWISALEAWQRALRATREDLEDAGNPASAQGPSG